MARLALVMALFLAVAGNADAQSKPVVDLDTVVEAAFPIGTIRPEQEQILVALIDDTRNTSDIEELADYRYRLAELYWAQHRAAKAKTDPKSQQEAKLFLIKGVKAFRTFVDDDKFRTYPKLDKALFLYGHLLYSGKYMKEARQVFAKLLKDFPNSAFVPDAYLMFADYYFEQGQLADAEAFYKKVLQFPKTGAYAYALYKMGFVYRENKQDELAADSFEKAARAATSPAVKQAALDVDCTLKAATADNYAAADRPDLEAAARGKVPAAVALSACEDSELAARLTAADTMPEDASVETRLAIASRYRVAGRYDLAVPVLVGIIEKNPMNGGAERAANLLLDTLVRSKEYDRTLEWVDRFANDKKFLDGRPELAKSIKFLRSRSLRKPAR